MVWLANQKSWLVLEFPYSVPIKKNQIPNHPFLLPNQISLHHLHLHSYLHRIQSILFLISMYVDFSGRVFLNHWLRLFFLSSSLDAIRRNPTPMAAFERKWNVYLIQSRSTFASFPFFPQNRIKLFDWLIDVSTEFDVSTETTLLAVPSLHPPNSSSPSSTRSPKPPRFRRPICNVWVPPRCIWPPNSPTARVPAARVLLFLFSEL